ncbi:hypothetical protein N9V60_03320 [Flavobacteriaceae bacterium]|nr:hypothetical protein [Flavobacteriaceae bacterium]MDB2340496.1 hypothetical protein [Flavobacteriaceae bacterium]
MVVKEGLLVIAGTFSPKKLNINGSGSQTVNVGGDVFLGEFEYDPSKLCVDSSGVVIKCPTQ